MVCGCVQVVATGQPELEFSPKLGSDISSIFTGKNEIHITVSLMVGGLPVAFKTLNEKCELFADARRPVWGLPVEVTSVESNEISWNINIKVHCTKHKRELTLRCKVSGGVATISKEVSFMYNYYGVLEKNAT